MIKNDMQVDLVKVVKGTSVEDEGGSAFIEVNGKTVEVIIHPGGDLDFDGDVISEEESEAVLDFFYLNEEPIMSSLGMSLE